MLASDRDLFGEVQCRFVDYQYVDVTSPENPAYDLKVALI